MEYGIENARGRLLGSKVIPSGRCTSISLECGDLFRLEGDQRGQLLEITEGRVWLTETGNNQDVILEQAQTYRIRARALVLLEGLPTARIRLI